MREIACSMLHQESGKIPSEDDTANLVDFTNEFYSWLGQFLLINIITATTIITIIIFVVLVAY